MNLDTLHYMVCVEEISQTKPYVKKVKKKISKMCTRNCKAYVKLTKSNTRYYT